MPLAVRDRAIHHAADQFHVALLFLFDRPFRERQRVLRATLNCSGPLTGLGTPHLYMGPEEEASGMPRGDHPRITKFRRSAHARAGKVPEARKGTTRAEGGKHTSPSVPKGLLGAAH